MGRGELKYGYFYQFSAGEPTYLGFVVGLNFLAL